MLDDIRQSFSYFNVQSLSVSSKEKGIVVEKTYDVLPATARTMSQNGDWLRWLRTAVRVTRKPHTKQGIEVEEQYYICNRKISPQRAERLIRQHWHVENRLHFRLDVNLGEDACRKSSFAGFRARIHGLVHNLLVRNTQHNWSDQILRNAADWLSILQWKGVL